MLIVTFDACICVRRNVIEQPYFSYADILPGSVMAVCLMSAFIDCFIKFSFGFQSIVSVLDYRHSAKYVITSMLLLIFVVPSHYCVLIVGCAHFFKDW